VELKLYLDRLDARCGARRTRAALATAVYVVEGALRVASGTDSGTLGANSAWWLSGDWELAGGSLPTIALRWELTPRGDPDNILTGEGIGSRLLLGASLALDSDRDYLLRCDRVDFPPGGVALTHVHAGGGIRCLLSGSIRIRTAGAEHVYRPLEPWFEAGPDPVFAAADDGVPTAFARAMILPREFLGRSSITYVNAEDRDKPRNQRYQVFLDQPFERRRG
jgi:hypothetical protein